MRLYIVMPAHNEQDYLESTLQALAKQTVLPNKLIVVNDNSTDRSPDIISDFAKSHDWVTTIHSNSKSNNHSPGSKVIEAFYNGFNTLDSDFDIICKFDADIILPETYIEDIIGVFKNEPNLGMASGLLFIKKNNAWVYENIADKAHIRGPIKAYRKECFVAIGGLKKAVGWDTLDTLLAKFHNWKTITLTHLHVKHLKPTGTTYTKAKLDVQGKALYRMRYGYLLAAITAFKISITQKKLSAFVYYNKGFIKAWINNESFLVTKEQGRFIRQYRWKRIKSKLF